MHQRDFSINLPNRRTALIFTDPAWYAGYRVPEAVIEEIRRWQLDTGSIVLVDGTFQYMRWDKMRSERSAALVPEQTFRLICPTKFVSIHGYRCAYLIVPARLRRSMADLNLYLHGDVSAADKFFVHRVAELMLTEGNGALIDLMKRNYERLREAHAIKEHIHPEAGFFLFSKIRKRKEQFLYLDQDSFELSGFSDYIRINLLNEGAITALISRI